MKEAVTWLSLLATGFTLVTTAHSSLIHDEPPKLPGEHKEHEEPMAVTRTAGVTFWLGDGENCKPHVVPDITHTITEYATTTVESLTRAVTPATITETSTRTVPGCPTAFALARVKAVKPAITVTTSTITSCSCTEVPTWTVPSSTEPPSSTLTPSTSSPSSVPTSTVVPTITATPSLTDTIITPPLPPTSTSASMPVTTVTTPLIPPVITPTIGVPGTTTSQSPSPTAPNSVCPSLISNPYYTPTAPLPEDYTWGCPPGYICHPTHKGDRANCTIEAGLPDVGYVCTPSDCVPAPPLDTDPSSEYGLSKEYYNLNPEGFGLDYSIYDTSGNNAVGKRFMSLRDFIASRKAKRVDITNIPTVCYNDCNDAAHEPQVLGKTPEICESDSAFMENVGICENCVTNNADDSESGSEIYSSEMQPTFAQWLNYCSDKVTSTTVTTATSTMSSSTQTTEVTTTSTSVPAASTGTTFTTTEATTSTKSTTAQSTSTQSPTTQYTEETTTRTQTEETSSGSEGTKTTETPTFITTSVPGTVITTSQPGTVVTTSFSGSTVTTEISGTLVTSSVPGSIITTSISGSVITTSMSGSTVTVPRGPSGSPWGSSTGSAIPSSSSPVFNGATSKGMPHIGFLGLMWAVFAPLL
ncbi:hypothetical protein N7461_008072 [Penicillium sp. DV-2018c]|nr:hypothetical protein N7461_008072 [Penicillium sp. DV-2018c]